MSPRGRPLLVRLVLAYFESSTPNYAAGLAFNAFLTMFPIVLGLFAVVGLVIHDASRVVVEAFPLEAQPTVRQTLEDATRNAGAIGAISIVGLLYAGTGLFGSLEFALDQIYRVPGRHFLRQRLLGLRLILVFVVAIVLAAALNAAAGLVQGQLLNVTAYLNVVAGWLVITYLLFWIYRYVPNRRMRVREVLPGALGGGALIELLALGFPLLWNLTHRASAYTRGFALLLALATWLYLMSQVLLMGALLNRLLAEGRSYSPVPGLEDTAPLAVAENAEPAGVEVREIRR